MLALNDGASRPTMDCLQWRQEAVRIRVVPEAIQNFKCWLLIGAPKSRLALHKKNRVGIKRNIKSESGFAKASAGTDLNEHQTVDNQLNNQLIAHSWRLAGEFMMVATKG